MRIEAIISAPRIGFRDNDFCAHNALTPLGIRLREYPHNAYWDQSLELCMDKWADTCDALLTIDYDSVFDHQQLAEMIRLFKANPHIDALMPVQQRRGEMDFALFVNRDADGTMILDAPPDESDSRLSRVETGHFGLTLIRTATLRTMPHPWFKAIPNEDGEWKKGKVDPDIYFWLQWRAAGKTLYMARNVRIGHLQRKITYPDQHFRGVDVEPDALYAIHEFNSGDAGE